MNPAYNAAVKINKWQMDDGMCNGEWDEKYPFPFGLPGYTNIPTE